MRYIKPQITSKKVKLNFFLTPLELLNEFDLVGKVYAQSSCSSCNQVGTGACTAGTSGNASNNTFSTGGGG